MAAYERQVRAAQRQAELAHWLELNQQMLSLAFVHKDEFPDAVPPVASAPEAIDDNEVLVRHQREALSGIFILKRAQRRVAKQQARESAAQEVQRERTRLKQERDSRQASLDDYWQRLTTNDGHTVMETIEAAFEDNEMPAAAIDVRDASATLLMKMGSPGDLIPEHEVTRTPTGKPTHKRRTKSAINALYAELMASHIVATAKEALAVAPSLADVRVLVIRGDRLGGRLQLTPLYAGKFERASMTRTDWEDLNVLAFIEAHGEINYEGQAQEVAALRTKGDPELRVALDQIADHLEWKSAP
jgi:hypothetical protein